MKTKKVKVSDKMQKGYVYEITESAGRNFDVEFRPELSPKQMFLIGAFGGRYMRDCQNEFPKDWFEKVKFHPEGASWYSK